MLASLRWTLSAVCLFLFFSLTYSAKAQDFQPLPTIPSPQSLARMALLSSAESIPSQESQMAKGVKESVLIFKRQGQWPLRILAFDGDIYTGEIGKIRAKDFELINSKTKQTVTLDYSSIQEIGIPAMYPRPKLAWANQTAPQRAGEVIGIILMLPFRILEQLLVPQC